LELMDAIKNRRSIRSYKPDPVPEEKVRAVLEAAIWAPKAWERWEFVVVREAKTRGELAKAAKGSEHLGEAPVDIVVCSNLRGAKARDRELYSIQEAAAAIQNLMLKAHEEGLGTCWVSEFREASVAKALGLPRGVRPLSIISLGHPGEAPAAPGRKGLDEVVHWERYGVRPGGGR
jgi:nitroreductase